MSVKCEVCGQEFKKQITNSHLRKHDMTTVEYKGLYGDDSLSCPLYRLEKSQRSKGESNPNFGKTHTFSDEQKQNMRGRVPWNKGKKVDVTDAMSEGIRAREERYKSGELVRTVPTMTNERKNKISEGVKRYSNENPDKLRERALKAVHTKKENGHDFAFFRGKTHTDETKAKISKKSSEYNKIKSKLSYVDAVERLSGTNLEIIGDWDAHYITLRCNDCGTEFEHTKQMLTESKFKETLCAVCNPRDIKRSKGEIAVFEYVKSICPDAIRTYYGLGCGELDIFVPSKNVSIEYNGLYYHSDDVLMNSGKSATADRVKYDQVLGQGVRPIVIFEDEWVNTPELVKSRLKHILGETSHKIYARKCEVKEISSKEASAFVKQHHIQGVGRSNVRMGMFHNEELIAVMSFSKSNISRKVYEWELNRFCMKSGISVVGGASKLFKGFIRLYDPHTIVSYADRRWSIGNVYEKLGFDFSHVTVPNYWYWLPNQFKGYIDMD